MKVDMPAGRGGVYRIKCLANDKVYIGATKDFALRFAEHYGALKRGKHPTRLMQDHWNELGMDGFEFVAFEFTDNIFARERYWIEFFKAKAPKRLYNVIVNLHQKRAQARAYTNNLAELASAIKTVIEQDERLNTDFNRRAKKTALYLINLGISYGATTYADPRKTTGDLGFTDGMMSSAYGRLEDLGYGKKDGRNWTWNTDIVVS